MYDTVYIPELFSGSWLGHFQKFGKIYFIIEIQIITEFDHFCGIQNTEKFKYNELTKYIGNINFHRAVDRLCVSNTQSVNSK